MDSIEKEWEAGTSKAGRKGQWCAADPMGMNCFDGHTGRSCWDLKRSDSWQALARRVQALFLIQNVVLIDTIKLKFPKVLGF